MSAAAARRVHAWAMAFWATQFAVVWFLPADWRVPYLVVVSIYANFVGHWSAYSAERPSEIQDA